MNSNKNLTQPEISSLRQQFVYFGDAGEMNCLSENAARWLKDYFPDWTSINHLPDALWKWISHQREALSQTSCEPFIWRVKETILIFRFPGDDPRHRLLLVTEHSQKSAAFGTPKPLTRREEEILDWIATGKTNPEIGTILGISFRTVHKHVERILEKLGVENRGAAAAHFFNKRHNHKKERNKSS